MSKERIKWIDNEKGFILLGVCIGHIGFSWNIFPYISTFHMAAFFFLSGLLFRPDRELTEFINSKCRNLLVPYILLSILFLFLSPSLYQLGTHYPGSDTQNKIASVLTDSNYLHSLLVQIQIYLLDIINGHSVPYVLPLWFIFTLFLLNVIWFFPIRLLSKCKYSYFYLGGIAIFCFVGGWILYMEDIDLPFNFSTCITASSFYIGGFLFKRIIPIISRISLVRIVILLLLLIGIYSYGVYYIKDACIGYIVNELDQNLPAYFAVSWGGALLLTLIFIICENWNGLRIVENILQSISLNGIAILALHNYILSCMRWGAETFHLPWMANHMLIAITIIGFCIICLPIINRHLYFCVGKKRPAVI